MNLMANLIFHDLTKIAYENNSFCDVVGCANKAGKGTSRLFRCLKSSNVEKSNLKIYFSKDALNGFQTLKEKIA